MFKFEPAEQCLYGGVTPAAIGHSIRNEFLMLFGDDAIDYRISVVLNERNIQFFYYDGEPFIGQGSCNMDKLKELGAISLTYPKETGNDILKFPKIGADCYPSDTNLEFFYYKEKVESNFLPILSSFQKLFYNFPFLKKYGEDSAKKNTVSQHAKNEEEAAELKRLAQEENFRNFIKSCLLAFVFEFEDREEIFAHSPLYDKVREKLRNSDVYRLLSSKIQYTLYVPENGINYDLDEYTYRTQKFADRLMDKRINKVIAPYDYTSKRKSSSKRNSQYRQTWFYDPEEELEEILDRNRKQLHVPKKERQGQELVFAPHLEQKIKNFLYTKHAISNAMTRKSGKRFFWVNQFLMLFISAAIIVSCFSPKLSHTIFGLYLPWAIIIGTIVFFVTILFNRIKENKKTKIYPCWIYGWRAVPQILLLLILLGSVGLGILQWVCMSTASYFFWLSFLSILLIGFSGYFNNPLKNFNKPKKLLSIDIAQSFYPRILVAELAAWLTLGIGEDLVKSMLWIDNKYTFLIIPMVLFFLIAILMGEAKQHSPYKRMFSNLFKKVLPILNHSIYFALCFGIIMQFLFYDNLVKNSDVIPSIVYSDYLGDANYYCQNLEHLDASMKQLELLTITSSIIGNVEMKGKTQMTSIIKAPSGDTIGTILSRNSMTMRNRAALETEEYNRYVNLINGTIKEIVKVKQDSNIKDCDYFPFLNVKNAPSCMAGGCYCILDTLNDYDTARNRSIIDINRTRIDMLKLNEEIANVQSGISMYGNYDTLMNWSKIDTKYPSLSGSIHLDILTSNAKDEHQCWEEVKICSLRLKLFPTLLLFHTLIVLVLAFVTQLIISDKSVTEPL